MTSSQRETGNAITYNSRRSSRSRHSEVRTTIDGLVFREQVRMLNGTGPLNEPMRVLYMDGSLESVHAYEKCEQAQIDFSVVETEPGTGVTLHDRLLHADFGGLEAIERGIAFAKQLYDEMEPLIEDALPEPMRTATSGPSNPIADAVEAEREERHKLVQELMARARG